MFQKLMCLSFMVALLLALGHSGEAQDKKKRTGTLIGEIKSTKETPNKKNQIVEVLATGEEKARAYRVQYDPAAKGPLPKVLEAVKAAKVGDRVQLDWIDTGEGLAITMFQVLKKGASPEKK